MIEIGTRENERQFIKNEIANAISDDELKKMLKEKLEKEEVNIKFSLDENKDIVATVSNKKNKNKSGEEIKTDSFWNRFRKSFCNICKETFDTIIKIFLKKKFNIKNSVYTDSKNGVKSIIKGDIEQAFTKISDAILGVTNGPSR